METATVIAVVMMFVALTSLLIAYHQYRDNHRTKTDEQLNNTIRQVASEVSDPLEKTVDNHSARLAADGDRMHRIEEMLAANSSDLKAMSEALTKMGVKVDMYWTTLESLAMNAAKGLHQPHPARARVDHLLEAFIEGTLTPEERTELKKVLVQIRNYEPGAPPLEFPVHQGEQTFAAILLSTMDVVNSQKLAAMGHHLHRAVRDKERRNG